MSWLSDLVGKIPVVGGAINSVAHNVVDPLARSAVSALPGGNIALNVGDTIGRMIPSPGGGGGSGGSALAGALGMGGGGNSGSGGGVNPLIYGLAGLGVANAASLGKTANDYSGKAWDAANQSYTDRAGLRSAGTAKLLNPSPPSTANLSSIRGSNPYARAGLPPQPPPSPSAPASLPMAA